MRLPMPVAAVPRRHFDRTVPTSSDVAAAGVAPAQCQCQLYQRGNRSMYVVDERNSHCPANTVATCNQANGACACNAIVPVVRPRIVGYDYRGAPA